MVKSIHISSQILSKAELLQRSTKKGQLALHLYSNLLKLMQSTSLTAPEIYNKRTKYGENRIQNCVKYDLGDGYRLITIKAEDKLYLQFIGTHDETDNWLKKHSGFSPIASRTNYPRSFSVTIVPPSSASQPSPSTPAEETDEYEAQLNDCIDDSLLQDVFRGICGYKS